MIEIAISLAVIGFALIAIVGILRIAMNVQKDNRKETIINKDNRIFLNAIRNGERGLDELTNYVVGITNYQTSYNPRGIPTLYIYGYSYRGSTLNGSATTPQWPLVNGYRIIGLLSTPQIIALPNGAFYSNHIVAVVRSISGPADEKSPQTNSTVQDFALSYRLFSTVVPYTTNFYDPSKVILTGIPQNSLVYTQRWDYGLLVQYYQTNMHELRLTYRWPILPNGASGPQRQVFRTLIAGPWTNDPPGSPFFFIQPNTFYRGSSAAEL